jgi:pyruvate dehydrogenase E1 component
MIAIVGDAELDEGNIHEALIESWKQDIRTAGGSSTTQAEPGWVVSDRLFKGTRVVLLWAGASSR